MILWLLLLVPAISYGDCSLEEIVTSLRPGAQWSISGKDIDTLVWNSTQTIPSKNEVTQAVATCKSALVSRALLKQQARLDVKNSGLTVGQRLQALLLLLDYD